MASKWEVCSNGSWRSGDGSWHSGTEQYLHDKEWCQEQLRKMNVMDRDEEELPRNVNVDSDEEELYPIELLGDEEQLDLGEEELDLNRDPDQDQEGICEWDSDDDGNVEILLAYDPYERECYRPGEQVVPPPGTTPCVQGNQSSVCYKAHNDQLEKRKRGFLEWDLTPEQRQEFEQNEFGLTIEKADDQEFEMVCVTPLETHPKIPFKTSWLLSYEIPRESCWYCPISQPCCRCKWRAIKCQDCQHPKACYHLVKNTVAVYNKVCLRHAYELWKFVQPTLTKERQVHYYPSAFLDRVEFEDDEYRTPTLPSFYLAASGLIKYNIKRIKKQDYKEGELIFKSIIRDDFDFIPMEKNPSLCVYIEEEKDNGIPKEILSKINWSYDTPSITKSDTDHDILVIKVPRDDKFEEYLVKAMVAYLQHVNA